MIEQELEVERWFVQEPFNPASPQQILDYMSHAGHVAKSPYKKKSKSNSPSTDETALARLAKKDKFYASILEFRKLSKLESTYVNGMMALIDANGRIHPKFLHNPSTWRLSCVEPNWQNIPDDDDEDSIERRFRHCVVAQPGHLLIEADFSAIEAVQTGWYCSDPDYVRLAAMGIHSYLVSHKANEPADLSWPDEQLAAFLAYIKKKYKSTDLYASMKRTVHLTNYGGSPHMMMKVDSRLFPTVRSAEDAQNYYLALMPKLKQWQGDIRMKAATNNFLGGADHPYRLKHWFWDVVKVDAYGTKTPGSDWNRVVAFYPQSTAAGNLFDTCLKLTDPTSPHYVGDMFEGRTPLRALIHDSILAEVPMDRVTEFCNKLHAAMTEPILVQPLPWDRSKHLTIEADIKAGPNWGAMEAVI